MIDLNKLSKESYIVAKKRELNGAKIKADTISIRQAGICDTSCRCEGTIIVTKKALPELTVPFLFIG